MSFKETKEEYYPIYKKTCDDTGQQPCLLGFIIWLNTNNLTTNGTPTPRMNTQGYTNPPKKNQITITINMKEILDHLRDKDIAQKAWNTKRNDNINHMEIKKI